MNPIDVTIIIPAFNERKIIVSHVDEVSEWMKKNDEGSFEIIVVDDGSTDGMSEVLTEASGSRPWLKVVHHSRNRGRGRALRTGFDASTGNYVVCLDADLSYSPDHITKLLAPLRANLADITLASAYHREGKVENVPFQRALISRLGNWLLAKGIEADINTVTCIVRAYRREVIEHLEFLSDGKELNLETLQKALLLGYVIQEVPAILRWRDKNRGQAKRLVPELQIVKMRRTVISHLIFNYISNPGILLTIPIVLLSLIVFAGVTMILITFFQNLATEPGTLFQIMRQTLLHGQLSLAIVLFAAITLMVFIVFFFLSFQNKKNFEEMYTLMMRMNRKIKQLEQED